MDVNKLVRAVILTSPAITALVGSRVYQGLLPRGYDIKNPAITYQIRGGDSDPDLPITNQSIGFHCWAKSPLDAMGLAIVLQTFLLSGDLHKTDSRVLAVDEESFGIPLVEPDVGWDSVLAYYNFLLKKIGG
jgi:hypothetical protein